MDKHNLTGIGLELETENKELTVKFFDETRYTKSNSTEDPFSEFNIAVDDYSQLIGMLIRLGQDLQKQSSIDFGLPSEEDISEEV